MASRRKEIRHTIVRLLTAKDSEDQYLTPAEDRVYANRPTPLWQSELPAICVYSKSEPVRRRADGPIIYTRNLQIVTELLVEGTLLCDDTLDDMQTAVEDILTANGYLRDPEDGNERLDGLIALDGTEMTLIQEGETIVGSNRITWITPYETVLPTPVPDDDLDAFETGNAQYDFDKQRPGPEAEDRFSIDQEQPNNE